MKRSLRLFGLAVVVALPAMVSAQESRPVTFGVSGGLALPIGDLGKGYSSGFDVTGHLAFKPASFTSLSFRGDVSFDRFGAKNSVGSTDVNLRAIGVTGNAIYSFPQSSPAVVRPYVIVGVGGFNTKSSFKNSTVSLESPSSTDVGVQGGGGINFQLSGFTTFVEAKFVNVFSGSGGNSSSATWIPITFGFRF